MSHRFAQIKMIYDVAELWRRSYLFTLIVHLWWTMKSKKICKIHKNELKFSKSNFMLENEISYKIRGAIFKVFNHFGPELLEPAYESA